MEETQNLDEFVVIREGEDKVVDNPDDSTLAEELQMQEVIIFFIESQKHPEDAIEPIKDSIDPKGKKAETIFYVTDGGESSKTPEETFYCAICMESKPNTETFAINPCNHIFCNSCITLYITTKLGDNMNTIQCPNPDCESGILDPLACQQLIPSDVFERWNLLLCECSLMESNKIYCPFNDCSALLLDERDGLGVCNVVCPHCHRMFCVRCKVAWHGDMSCEEFEKLGKDGREIEGLMLINLAQNSKWQRCPHCKMFVERTEGCRFMKCRCAYCFCYDCGSPMTSETHCNKCNR